ncbi:choice-of-anchor G family protein [Microbacterium sp.]|uniref:choice-of-anchor G family protein n=1 Tax=Microbacterium sp. TaxID=51671 RepID=UPI0039E5C09B
MKTKGRALRTSRALAIGAIGALVIGHVMGANAAFALPGDESASSSRFLSGSLLLNGVELDDVTQLAGVATTHDGSTPTPNTQTSSLDLTALNALNITVPGGLSVPLGSFLSLGAVNQYSQSSDGGASRAATGAVSDTGVIDTTGGGAYPGNASLDLGGLLGDEVAAVVADLDLELRAISAEAAIDGAGTVTRDYNVAGADLTLSLPAIAGLNTVLTGTDGVADTVDNALASLVGPNGLLAGVLQTLTGVTGLLGSSDVDISISTDVDAALTTLLTTPISDADGVLSVNLSTGIVTVDLNELLLSTPGVGHGLNDLDVNEEVLSTPVLNNLIDRVGSVLQTVPELVRSTLTRTLNAAVLNVDVDVCTADLLGACLTGVQASVPNAPLSSVLDGTASATISAEILDVPVLGLDAGSLLGALTGPLNNVLFGPTGVVNTVVPTVTTAVNGIITAIDPAIDLLNGVVSLRGNVQPDNGPIYSQEAFVLTVGDVLGTGGAGTVVLAHAQAGPNAVDISDVAITSPAGGAEFPVADAGSTTELVVTGTGEPGATVTVTIPGIPDPQTTTVGVDGTWTVTFPAVPVGDHTITATQAGGSTDTVDVSVVVEDADADATDADATDADATDADATDADATDADATDADATDADATDADATDADATDADATDADATDADATDADATDADATDADATDADATDADATDADATDADATDADATDADATDADATDADATDADATDADATDADADATDADATDADATDADATDADATDADATDADATDADATDADATDADTTDADATDADVTDADATDADATDADATDADATDADATDADATDADATDADATDADATDADATDADATDADATDADATDADATDADATDADATDADATDADATDADATDADATDADATDGDTDAGEIGIVVKVPTLYAGQVQTAIGTGFKPGETVKGTMFSSPLALGSQVADSKGEVTFVWTIPQGTDLGAHTVTLTGAESGSVSGTFQVVAKNLATTGGTIGGALPIGIALLALGLLAAAVDRRKTTA